MKKILIIGQKDRISNEIRDILSMEKFEIIQAEDIENAFIFIEILKPELIINDIESYRFKKNLLFEMIEKFGEKQIIIFSQKNIYFDESIYMNKNNVTIMELPVSVETLLQKVNEIFKKK